MIRRTFVNFADKYANRILKSSSSHGFQPFPLNLSELVRIEDVQRLSQEKAKDIWIKYFEAKPFTLGLCLGSGTFKEWFVLRSKVHPMSIVPLRTKDRDGRPSVINYICQHESSSNRIYFTDLESYKLYGCNASWCLTASCYGDLHESNSMNLAFLAAKYHPDHLQRHEADSLIRCMIRLYCHYFDWIERFNRNPSSFDYQSFLNAILDTQ